MRAYKIVFLFRLKIFRKSVSVIFSKTFKISKKWEA